MKVKAPKGDELAGGKGNYLKTPGTYHVLVTNVSAGKGPKGTPIDGFTCELKVLAGDAVDKTEQFGKEFSLSFFAPNLQSEEKQQAMNERQNAAFFVATNCLMPSDLGKELEIDETLANGAQFIVKLVYGQKKVTVEGGKEEWVDDPSLSLRVHYSDIWHVDDPDCKSIPKHAESIALIDVKDRHKEEWFSYKKPRAKSAAVTAAASDLDGIF